MVDPYKLEAQQDDFRLVMEGRQDEETKASWMSILADRYLREEISEFCKLANIMLCIPIGSVQNERCFSQMNLIKSDLRNRLGHQHLNAAMRIRRSKYTLESFPVHRAVQKFLQIKERRGVHMEDKL